MVLTFVVLCLAGVVFVGSIGGTVLQDDVGGTCDTIVRFKRTAGRTSNTARKRVKFAEEVGLHAAAGGAVPGIVAARVDGTSSQCCRDASALSLKET